MDYPVLPTEINNINRQLIEHFGVDTITGKPMWRVSWSTDQYEKRLTKYTDGGIELLQAEVRELPKYQHCRDRWILERLVLVPEINQAELPHDKQSYENMWTFQSREENALQPSFEACKFLVDLVYAALGKKSLKKYVDPEGADPIQAKIERVEKLMEELFGDESDLKLKTITGEAVAYTGPSKMENNQ